MAIKNQSQVFLSYNNHVKKLTLLVSFWLALLFVSTGKISAATGGGDGGGVPTRCEAGTVDLTPFVAPDCGGGSCPPVTSTAKGETYSHECAVQNSVQWVDTTTFKQNSGDVHFLYRVEGGSLKFLQDTIWGGFNCSDGGEAMYRTFTGTPSQSNPTDCDISQASWGQIHTSLSLGCGAITTKPTSYLCSYHKPNPISLINEDYDMPLQECSVAGQSRVPIGGSSQLIFQGQAKCCDQPFNIAAIRTVTGPGQGETYFYCEGRGLCAHYQNLNFSDPENQPTSWDENTDVCQLKASQSQGDKADYYLTPIKGLLKKDKDEFYTDLVAQGYEAHCTVPKISIVGTASMDEVVKTMIGQLDTLEVNSQQLFDYSQVHIPLLRDKKEEPALFNSIEDYWGFKDNKTTDPIKQKIASAPIYTIMPLYEQCQNQIKMLANIERMCNKLENPATCALDQPIPMAENITQGYRSPDLEDPGSQEESIYSAIGLLNAFRQNTGLTCDKIAFHRDQLTTQEKNVAASLANVPFYLDKAYRLGFLVVSAELKNPPDSPPGWNFLRFLDRTDLPKNDVRVIAFKLPDITTNRDYDSDIFYKDTIQLTRDSLLTKDQIFEIRQQAENKKNLSILPGSQTRIDCNGNSYCENPLVKSLTEFINNRLEDPSLCSANPDNLPYEEGGSSDGIFDTGDASSSAGTKHVLPTESGDVIEALNQQGIYQQYPPEGHEDLAFKFLSVFGLQKWATDNVGPSDTNIESYLIIPQGYELSTVEDTLAGLIYSREELNRLQIQESQADQDFDYSQYFKLSETGQEFPQGKAMRQYGECSTTDTTGTNPNCHTVEAIVKSVDDEGGEDPNQTDREPRIFGAKLGFFMRKLQQALHPVESLAWNYIENSKTVEQYLMGLAGDEQPFSPQGEDLSCVDQCGEDFESGSTEYQSCVQDCGTSEENIFCIDWKLKETNGQEIASRVRNYLTSLGYTYDQNPTRTELVENEGPFLDWNNDNIPANKTNYYENFYGGGRALLWTKSPECNNQICFEYIMDRCLNPNSDGSVTFNPAVCVGMNLTESGGSNHLRFPGSADFGCMAGDYPNVSANLNCLISESFFQRPIVYEKDFNGMWLIYAEHGFSSSSYRRLREYYQAMTDGLGFVDGQCPDSWK